ncbi:hexose kinase [Bacteriovorax sp. PP10]|uniref:Hexose kinase n=1 Tax=Bacteriovorax antarcticus TaxID=3088717 RepID=A0ABU5VQ40_9BACT|nr:hexose kinase [Bacteriovorax sp. PP10]MEA9355161.1 hexose kinase [Bacteriovorax sp. PP10]
MSSKKTILSLTPNPSLDLGGTVTNSKLNEKNYVFNETRFAGGNAINASRILSRLKIPVIASGFLGGPTGVEILNLLSAEKLKNNFIKINNNSRTCVTISNDLDHNQVRFNFPGPLIKSNEKNKMLDLLNDYQNISLILIGGSLPPGVKSRDILKFMNLAKKKNIKCIVDCPGPILEKIIKGRPLMIKPNLTEFQQLMKTKVKSISSVERLAKELLQYVQYVCVSSVEGGTLLVTKDHSYFGKIPHVKINSTVGAGDSMVGAIAREFFKNNSDPGDLLRWGLAASAATLLQKGTQLGSARDIERLYKKCVVHQLD